MQAADRFRLEEAVAAQRSKIEWHFPMVDCKKLCKKIAAFEDTAMLIVRANMAADVVRQNIGHGRK